MIHASTFGNVFRYRQYRNRILFTLFMLALYRLGGFIPIPGVNIRAWEIPFGGASSSALGFLDTIAAGNIKHLSIFALGGLSTIAAEIIIQILCLVVPNLKKAGSEGEAGRRKINRWTPHTSVVITFLISLGAAILLLRTRSGVVIQPGIRFLILATVSMTAGSAFITWISQQIGERGIGNGSSMLVLTGIVTKLPAAADTVYYNYAVTHQWNVITMIVISAVMVAVVPFIVLVERAERRIPIQQDKEIRGRRILGGSSRHMYMPIRLSPGGARPLFYALVLMSIPGALLELFRVNRGSWMTSLLETTQVGEPLYYVLLPACINFFCLLYSAVIFDPKKIADNLIKEGSFIPGIMPGPRTADFINDIIIRIAVADGIYLTILCIVPDLMFWGIRLQHLPLVGGWIDGMLVSSHMDLVMRGLGVHVYFGGEMALIAVTIAMELVDQIEAWSILRHFEGILPVFRTAR